MMLCGVLLNSDDDDLDRPIYLVIVFRHWRCVTHNDVYPRQ